MKTYYEQDGITIYHGDCREVLPDLRADVIITDPPYGLGFRSNGWDSEIPKWLSVAREVAPLVVFTTAPTTQWDYPRPDWVMCWYRPASNSRTPIGKFNHWSPILVYGKGGWNPDCFYLNAMTAGNENRGICHPSPKPERLMRWLVCGTSGSIIDPFAGSGTTLVAAKVEGRRAIGIELEERYCEEAAKRLAQGVLFGEAVSA